LLWVLEPCQGGAGDPSWNGTSLPNADNQVKTEGKRKRLICAATVLGRCYEEVLVALTFVARVNPSQWLRPRITEVNFRPEDHHRLIVQWHSATGVQPDHPCFVGGVNTVLGSQLVLNTDKRRNIHRGARNNRADELSCQLFLEIPAYRGSGIKDDESAVEAP
jgi:hypothetical protein